MTVKRLTRRRLLAGGAAAAATCVVLSRESDHSGARDIYFLEIQEALIAAGIATPTIVIDKTRLNENIDTLMADLPAGMGYRIVAKSLPAEKLISHIRDRTRSDRLMTFNLPMLLALSTTMPEADQLLGKPLPVAAARTYFEKLPNSVRASAQNVQWLIDSSRRVEQYGEIANALGVDLRVNLELDVGLHRGGFEPGADLISTLEIIRRHDRLSFSGFMGYEPHIVSMPSVFGWQNRVRDTAWEIYRSARASATEVFGADELASLSLNAAGSPTYRLYKDTQIANEVSVGSALVKPTHFDTELLAMHKAASFIAAPVVKAEPKTRIPGLEFAGEIQRFMNPNTAKTAFIYGGNWLAEPVDPPGLSYNEIFGRSSNQEMLNGGAKLNVKPDDFVFFRPHQSEAVFLHFGDIAVFENGAIVDYWPVFPAFA